MVCKQLQKVCLMLSHMSPSQVTTTGVAADSADVSNQGVEVKDPEPWTTLEISRNCDYFRGIQRMTELWILERGELKKGNQSEGIPKRGI